MRQSVLILLVVSCSLLLGQTEAGWFRRTVHFVKDWAPAVIAVGSVVGKRADGADADDSGMLLDMVQTAESLGKFPKKLREACPSLGVDLSQGLTKDELIKSFDQLDVDQDGSLKDGELTMFGGVFNIYMKCVEQLAETKDQ